MIENIDYLKFAIFLRIIRVFLNFDYGDLTKLITPPKAQNTCGILATGKSLHALGTAKD